MTYGDAGYRNYDLHFLIKNTLWLIDNSIEGKEKGNRFQEIRYRNLTWQAWYALLKKLFPMEDDYNKEIKAIKGEDPELSKELSPEEIEGVKKIYSFLYE